MTRGRRDATMEQRLTPINAHRPAWDHFWRIDAVTKY
jgi:hypothetical protein